MDRLKNYALWFAILAYIPEIVEAFTEYDILVKLPSNYGILTKGLLAIFVLAGILNNPSQGTGYLDK